MTEFDFCSLQDVLALKDEHTYSRYQNIEVDASKNKIEINFEKIDLFLLMHFENENVKIKIEKNNIVKNERILKVKELVAFLTERGLDVIFPKLNRHPALLKVKKGD